MGTTLSPWRYDPAARYALPIDKSATACDLALCVLGFRYRRVVRLPFDSGHAEHFRDRRDGANFCRIIQRMTGDWFGGY